MLEAIGRKAGETWMYNDPENYELREALALHHGVSRDNIAIGGGIDGLLGEIVRLVVEPGAPVVTSLGGYPTFNYHVNGYGGRLVTVPYVNDREDLDGLLAAAKREDAPLVYFANPDNPMGSWWDADSVVAFARALPERSLLILDEAYCETAPAGSTPPIEALIGQPNVLRMRTFSKAYGLAGARVGYAIGTIGNAQAFDKIRNHFGMARISTAAALAALEDQAYLRDVVGRIAAARERIAAVATRKRPASPALGHEFRRDRLRPRRRPRPRHRRRADGARRLHPHAGCRTAEPLHSRQRRPGGGNGTVCGGAAEGA